MKYWQGMSAPRGAADKRSGSLLRALDTGNSNRVLGLFSALPKGVK
jgi:hypothetical protein